MHKSRRAKRNVKAEATALKRKQARERKVGLEEGGREGGRE